MPKTEGKVHGVAPRAGGRTRADGAKRPVQRRRWFFRILVCAFLGLPALLAAAWVLFPEQAVTRLLTRQWHRAFPAISLRVSKLRPALAGLRGEGVELRWKRAQDRRLFHARSVTARIAGFDPSSMFPRFSVKGECGVGSFDATVDPGSAVTTMGWRFTGCRMGLPQPVMGTDFLEIEDGAFNLAVSGRRLAISSLRARLRAGTVELRGIVRLGEQGAESGHLDLRGTLTLDSVRATEERPYDTENRSIQFALTGSPARPTLRILPNNPPLRSKSSADPPSTPLSGGSATPDDQRLTEKMTDRFRLVGTVTGTPTTLVAIIEDRIDRSQGMFRLGEMVGGGVLKAILRDRVVVAFGDQEIVLLAGRGDGGDSREAFGGIPLAMPEVDGALAELDRTLSQVRIRARTGGPDRGVEIVDVAPGSIYERMGIRAGDIVQAINGTPIENPALFARLHDRIGSLPLEISVEGMESAAPEILTAIDPGLKAVSREAANLAGRIRSGDPIAVTIRRHGKARTLSYRVTPDD